MLPSDRLKLIAVALLLVLLGVLAWRLTTRIEQIGADHCAVNRAEDKATASAQQAQAVQSVLDESNRVVLAQSKAKDAEYVQRMQSDKQLVDLRAESGKLRQSTAALAASCRSASAASAAASGSTAGRSTGDLFADVQGRLTEALQGVGDFGDREHRAVALCKAYYEAPGASAPQQ